MRALPLEPSLRSYYMAVMTHLVLSLLIPTLAGTATVVALVSGVASLAGLLVSAGLGAALAVPAGLWLVQVLKNL